MKQPVAQATGYTKTQVIIVVFAIIVGTLTLIPTTEAAIKSSLTNLEDAPFIGKEYISPPDNSPVMLTGDAHAEAQSEWNAEYDSPEAVGVVYMTASAYNSVPGQTDGSPFHTAIGSLTRDGVIASNYFPIGTKIRIPDHYGDKVFRVEDRMNPRYNKTLDIWMEDIQEAKQWGRRYIKVEIVKYGLGRGVE